LHLSKHDHRFADADAVRLEIDSVARATGTTISRPSALARFLSHSEGWEDALDSLGGAFAETSVAEPSLRPAKEE
jgi:hypothetical protein